MTWVQLKTYRCQDCDVVMRDLDRAPKHCPYCGKPTAAVRAMLVVDDLWEHPGFGLCVQCHAGKEYQTLQPGWKYKALRQGVAVYESAIRGICGPRGEGKVIFTTSKNAPIRCGDAIEVFEEVS